MFKAHVQVGGSDPRDPLLAPVWGLLAESATPVVVHCGSGAEAGHHTGPGVFAEVLARHPRLIAIVAHMSMPEYEEFPLPCRALSEGPAGHDDGVHGVHREAPAVAGLTHAPAGRPGRPHPAGRRLPEHPVRLCRSADRLDLGDDWPRGVCHDNAARLFGV